MAKLISSLTLVCMLAYASAQNYNLAYSTNGGAPNIGVIHDPNAADPRYLSHPAVVENAARESQLPQELLNPFYKNPQIAAGLARDSWFGENEFPTFNRQAEKIPRSEIAKIIKRIRHLERRRREVTNYLANYN